MLLVALGLAIGLPAAMALGQLVAAQLYGVKPHDPWMAGVAILMLISVAGAAGLVPARRAARLDPILALRQE